MGEGTLCLCFGNTGSWQVLHSARPLARSNCTRPYVPVGVYKSRMEGSEDRTWGWRERDAFLLHPLGAFAISISAQDIEPRRTVSPKQSQGDHWVWKSPLRGDVFCLCKRVTWEASTGETIQAAVAAYQLAQLTAKTLTNLPATCMSDFQSLPGGRGVVCWQWPGLCRLCPAGPGRENSELQRSRGSISQSSWPAQGGTAQDFPPSWTGWILGIQPPV